MDRISNAKLARAPQPLVEKLFDRVVELAIRRNRNSAKREAIRLLREDGHLSMSALVNSVAEDAARWAGAYGLVTGVVESVPGYGRLLAVFGLLPDAMFMLYFHAGLAIYVAHLYDPHISRTRLKVVVSLALLAALTGEAARSTVRRAAIRGARALTNRMLSSAVRASANRLLRNLGLRLTKRGVLRHLPVIGAVINAAAIYGELKLAGRAYNAVMRTLLNEPIETECPWCGGAVSLFDGYGTYTCTACRNELTLTP